MTYAPSELSISRGHARLGAMQADVEGSLDLDHWVFRPENEWSADVNFEKVPLESFQGFIAAKYPVEGTLTGQFHGHGTREKPAIIRIGEVADSQNE